MKKNCEYQKKKSTYFFKGIAVNNFLHNKNVSRTVYTLPQPPNAFPVINS